MKNDENRACVIKILLFLVESVVKIKLVLHTFTIFSLIFVTELLTIEFTIEET